MLDYKGIEHPHISPDLPQTPLDRLNGRTTALNGIAGNVCSHGLLVSTGAGRKVFAVYDDQREKIIFTDGTETKATQAKLAQYNQLKFYKPGDTLILADGREVKHVHRNFGNTKGNARWAKPPGEPDHWQIETGNNLPGIPIVDIEQKQ